MKIKVKIRRVVWEMVEIDNDIDKVIEWRDKPNNIDVLLIDMPGYTIIGQAHEDYNDNAIAFDYR